jgi:SNF2 family DNA or RNA helicase
MMAVHTSNVEPLPHQITAVYESMLPRQPLRYVLADDPGAGKTIMAGLFIRELLMRADAKRVLIVAPGSLVEQWQDEMFEKFGLTFSLFSREQVEQSRSGNPFDDIDLMVARVDQLSRNEDLQEKLRSRTGTWSSSTKRTSCRPATSATRSTRPSASSSANCWARSRGTSC